MSYKFHSAKIIKDIFLFYCLDGSFFIKCSKFASLDVVLILALWRGVESGVNWWSKVKPIMNPTEAELTAKTDSSALTQGVSLL